MFVHPRQLVQVLANQAVVSRYDHRDALAVRVKAQAGVNLDINHLPEALRAAGVANDEVWHGEGNGVRARQAAIPVPSVSRC